MDHWEWKCENCFWRIPLQKKCIDLHKVSPG